MLQMRAVKRAVGSAGGEYLQSPKSTVTDATDGTDATPIIDAAPESYLFPSGEAPVRTTVSVCVWRGRARFSLQQRRVGRGLRWHAANTGSV
jgi:hypothetical protein